jgi:hypothetical protein
MQYYYETEKSIRLVSVVAGNDIDVLDFLKRKYGSLKSILVVYVEMSKDNFRVVYEKTPKLGACAKPSGPTYDDITEDSPNTKETHLGYTSEISFESEYNDD